MVRTMYSYRDMMMAVTEPATGAVQQKAARALPAVIDSTRSALHCDCIAWQRRSIAWYLFFMVGKRYATILMFVIYYSPRILI